MTTQASSNSVLKNDDILSCVLDACVYGIIVVDAHYEIVAWNQWMENHSQISQTQAVGQQLFTLFPSLRGKRIEAAIKNAIQHNNAATLSHAMNRNPFPLYSSSDQGEIIKQGIFIIPIDVTNKNRQCVIQIQDVTPSVRRELLLREIAKEAEQAKTTAEQLSQVKTEFISTVSHELRTPLTSILGSLGLICGGKVGEVSVQATGLANIAKKNSQHLLFLINDLLDIDKIESGNMDFRFENVEIMPLIEESINCNNGLSTQYEVQFKITERLLDQYVYGDSDRLIQIMSNLLSNAAKFSPPNGTIEIAVKQIGDKVRINITDQGPGIPKDFQAKLFDKFTQFDSSDTRKVGGTGLGLSIVKAIVESHNGQISFDSQPNIGTTFHIDLPLLTTQ